MSALPATLGLVAFRVVEVPRAGQAVPVAGALTETCVFTTVGVVGVLGSTRTMDADLRSVRRCAPMLNGVAFERGEVGLAAAFGTRMLRVTMWRIIITVIVAGIGTTTMVKPISVMGVVIIAVDVDEHLFGIRESRYA